MDLDKARERLLSERVRVEREIQDIQESINESLQEATEEQPFDQHLADSASPTFARELDLTLADNERTLLALIDRALAKVDNGTYGVCDNCGRPIGESRLEIAPWATLCIDCKRREKGR